MAINSLSASSKGISGLVSGIDTESMVTKLLAGTQAKIDKANQSKTILNYKQSMYREVAAKLKTLQSSFMSFSSKTNLYSSNFYNSMNAVVSTQSGKAAAFSVTASSSTSTGTHTVDYIKQLASAHTVKTTTPASSAVVATLDKTYASELLDKYSGENANLTIKVGNNEVTIADVANKFGGKSATQIVDLLNSELSGIGAKAAFVNNKLTISADNSEEYISIHGNGTDKSFAMQLFGSDTSSLSGKGSIEREISTDGYMPGFDVELDGRKQTIRMSMDDLRTLSDTGDGTDLVNHISDELRRVFGTGIKLNAATDNGKTVGFSLETGKTQKFSVTGKYQEVGMLGLKSGISNKLNTSMGLKDLNFATELQGTVQTFKINGVEFSYDTNTTLKQIFSDIEKSKAGVTVSYDEANDRFVIKNKVDGYTGVGDGDIKFEQTEGNLLSSLFGVAGSGAITTGAVNKSISGSAVNSEMEESFANGGTFSFTVDGTKYQYTIDPKEEEGATYTAEEIREKLNERLKTSFGTNGDGSQVVELKLSAGSFELTSTDTSRVLTVSAYDATSNSMKLGFTAGDTTRMTSGSGTLAQAGIAFGSGGLKLNVNGSEVMISGAQLDGKTMDQVAQVIQDTLQAAGASGASVQFDGSKAGFRFLGVDVPMEIVALSSGDSKNVGSLFGKNSIKIDPSPVDDPNFDISYGSNAVFSIDGVEMERMSNSFTVDGMTFSLNATTPMENGKAVDGPATVNVTRDTETIAKALEDYIKLYNETVDFINNLYKADPTYKDYAPLTEAQKKEMSDREIELWEEKSKEGLLRSDPALEKILQNMRSAMYSKPEGSSIAIYDLGLGTSFYASDGNFVVNGEGKLRSMLESDPEGVMQLFSATGGIMDMLNNAITNATGGSGSLTNLAGTATTEVGSSIYKQKQELDKQMTTLESKYQTEYNRYWKQFNAMEQMIQQMNTQSAWLSSQFS